MAGDGHKLAGDANWVVSEAERREQNGVGRPAAEVVQEARAAIQESECFSTSVGDGHELAQGMRLVVSKAVRRERTTRVEERQRQSRRRERVMSSCEEVIVGDVERRGGSSAVTVSSKFISS